jgi:AcrR family transcriptional regulator
VRNQRGEGERLRAALLDAATELLGETHDVDRLSVRAVTARAGVSPTALYLHFADKDALTDEVKHRCFEAFGETLAQARDTHPDDPPAQLRAMGLAYLRFAREQHGRYGILFETRHRGYKERAEEAEQPNPGTAAFGLLVDTVGRCLPAVAEDEAFELSCILWTALHGRAAVGTAMPEFPFPDDEAFVELLAQRVLGG